MIPAYGTFFNIQNTEILYKESISPLKTASHLRYCTVTFPSKHQRCR